MIIEKTKDWVYTVQNSKATNWKCIMKRNAWLRYFIQSSNRFNDICSNTSIIYIVLLGKFSRKKGMGKYEHKKYENNEILM